MNGFGAYLAETLQTTAPRGARHRARRARPPDRAGAAGRPARRASASPPTASPAASPRCTREESARGPMNVGVVGNPRYADLRGGPASSSPASRRSAGITLCSSEPRLGRSGTAPPPDLDAAPLDALLTFGGDGTLLRGARLLDGPRIPILGVNLGRVGFLTSVSRATTLPAALDALVAGRYTTRAAAGAARPSSCDADGTRTPLQRRSTTWWCTRAAWRAWCALDVERRRRERRALQRRRHHRRHADRVHRLLAQRRRADRGARASRRSSSRRSAPTPWRCGRSWFPPRATIVRRADRARSRGPARLVRRPGRASPSPPGARVEVRRAETAGAASSGSGAEGYFTRMREKLHWGDLSDRERRSMIAELRVRDLATIADVTLPLGPGLNVLTGETGAGKSMLVDALGPPARRPRATAAWCGRAPAARSSRARSRLADARCRRRLEALGVDAGRGPHRDPARGLHRGALPRLGQRQPRPPSACSPRSAPSWWTCTASTRPQSLLQPDAQRDILDAFAGAAQSARRVAEAHAALAGAPRGGGGAGAAARRGAPPRRLPAPRGRRRSTPPGSRPARTTRWTHEAPPALPAGTLAEQARGCRERARRRGRRGAARRSAPADRALAALERVDPDGRRLAGAARRRVRQPRRAGAARRARYADEAAGRSRAAGRGRAPARPALPACSRSTARRWRRCSRRAGPPPRELDLLDTADARPRARSRRREARPRRRRCAGGGARSPASGRQAAERLARAVARLLPKLGLPGGKFEVALTPLGRDRVRTAPRAVTFTVRLNAGHRRPAARRRWRRAASSPA